MMQVNEVFEVVDAGFEAVTEDIADLVKIPSVSSDAFDQQQLDNSALAVANILRDAGVENVEIIKLQCEDGRVGRPALLGSIPGPSDAPRVLLYAHHDVQPPGPASDWDTEAFTPTIKGERMYGRGAGDDKAGIMLHVGTLRAIKQLAQMPVNVTVFIEGEEEIGSPTFNDFLTAYQDRLDADVIIVADSGNWKVGTPSLTTSLRGVVSVDVEISVTEHALHSGMFGGPILDAVTIMCRLIATLHDTQGNVAVDGLVAREVPGTADYPETSFRKDAALLPGVHLAGSGPLSSRLWTKPAIGVIGMDVTSTALASNTIWPTCKATLSMRVAPGQDAKEAAQALVRHLQVHAPLGAQLKVSIADAGPAFDATESTPVMEQMRWALETAWESKSQDVGQGGSIPFVADLKRTFPQAQVLVTGVEDPDTRAHSGNESVHLGEIRKAVRAQTAFLLKLGKQI